MCSKDALADPMAASAALRAIVVFARNFGRKSSTAIWLKSRTTALAHFRAVSCRCAATLAWVFAALSLARLYPADAGLPGFGLRRAICRWYLASFSADFLANSGCGRSWASL